MFAQTHKLVSSKILLKLIKEFYAFDIRRKYHFTDLWFLWVSFGETHRRCSFAKVFFFFVPQTSTQNCRDRLLTWCNHLKLCINKTDDLVVDYDDSFLNYKLWNHGSVVNTLVSGEQRPSVPSVQDWCTNSASDKNVTWSNHFTLLETDVILCLMCSINYKVASSQYEGVYTVRKAKKFIKLKTFLHLRSLYSQDQNLADWKELSSIPGRTPPVCETVAQCWERTKREGKHLILYHICGQTLVTLGTGETFFLN